MRISDWSSDVCSSDLAYRIVRLKDKLGTRSMASGEIVMDGALAWMVGPPGQGFVQMAEMINQSRLSNAVLSAGMMRRALREALAVARGRTAFGPRPLDPSLQRRPIRSAPGRGSDGHDVLTSVVA